MPDLASVRPSRGGVRDLASVRPSTVHQPSVRPPGCFISSTDFAQKVCSPCPHARNETFFRLKNWDTFHPNKISLQLQPKPPELIFFTAAGRQIWRPSPQEVTLGSSSYRQTDLSCPGGPGSGNLTDLQPRAYGRPNGRARKILGPATKIVGRDRKSGEKARACREGAHRITQIFRTRSRRAGNSWDSWAGPFPKIGGRNRKSGKSDRACFAAGKSSAKLKAFTYSVGTRLPGPRPDPPSVGSGGQGGPAPRQREYENIGDFVFREFRDDS